MKTLNAQQFGLKLDGSDEGEQLQKLLDLTRDTAFDLISLSGRVGTSQPIKWTGHADSSKRNFHLSLEIVALSKMDTLLHIHGMSLGHLGGKLVVRGNGIEVKNGVLITDSSRGKIDALEAYQFRRYGIWIDGGVDSNASLMSLGNVRAIDCGEGIPRLHTSPEVGWSDQVNAGSSNSGNQTSTFVVDSQPTDPAMHYCSVLQTAKICKYNVTSASFVSPRHGYRNSDTIYVSGDAPKGAVPYFYYYVVNATANSFQLASDVGGTPIRFSSSGGDVSSEKMSLHVVINRSPENGTVSVYPWAIPSGDSGKLYYHGGAGVRIEGDDAASIEFESVDTARCSIAMDVSSLYGPLVQRQVSQFDFCGASLGLETSSAMISGVWQKSYFEGNCWNIIRRSLGVSGVQYIGIQPSNWAKVTSIVPVNQSGKQLGTLGRMDGITFIDDGFYSVSGDYPDNIAGSITDLSLGKSAHLYQDKAVVRLQANSDLNRLFGTASVRTFHIGTGVDGAPRQHVAFAVHAKDRANGYRVMGGDLHTVTLKRAQWVTCFLLDQNWMIVPENNQ